MMARAALHHRGVTLVELMIGLAIAATLASLALPSFSGYLQRQRLKAVATMMDTDLREARFEATRRGQAMHLVYQTGPDWCYALATEAGCDCRVASACRLKTVRAQDVRSVQLLQAQSVRFDPSSGRTEAAVNTSTWGVPHGERLQVSVNAMGRPAVCVADGNLPPFTSC